MAILKQLPTIFMAVLLTGCYEDFTPEIDTTPVLCVNSLVTAGERIEVNVSRTRLYTESSLADYQVSDAKVSIYANGELKDMDYIPKEGDRIRIEVKSTAYGTAEAETTVPHAVAAESLTHEPSLTDSWTADYDGTAVAGVAFNLSVALEIADPGATENYYQLSISGFNGDGEISDDDIIFSPNPPATYFSYGTLRYDAEPIFSEHIGEFESAVGNDDSQGFTFFTDRQFSGKSYTLHLIFDNCAYSARMYDGREPEPADCGIELCLHSISKSYYSWANYLWQSDEGLIADMGDFGLGDPIWGYSNVSTGAGIVAARSSITYRISLKDFIEQEMPNFNIN